MEKLYIYFSCKLLFIHGLLACLPMAATNISTDQSALLAFKSHITSDPQQILATNWSAESSVCEWVGVTCDSGHHHRVKVLNISNMGLSGTIPPHLGHLSFLVSLDLSKNNFLGYLPSELAHLRRLKVINFSMNNLGGEIPSSFGFLHQLQFFSLRNNSFTGYIPPSISNMSNLQTLVLSFNHLQGVIPKVIGNLKHLRILSLHSNSLTGEIPKDIGNMSMLRELALGYNKLKGPIPRELSNLTQMYSLFLHSNNLTGTIPSEIFNIFSLKLIQIGVNSLSGSLPNNIGSLSGCRNFQLFNVFDNMLSGEIPSSLSQCSEIRLLGLSRNNFSGSIPKELGNMKMLQEIYLGSNRLTGLIPKEIGNLSMLQIIDLDGNFLTGVIPQELHNLNKIEKLVLSRNYLSGSIPIDALANCRFLTVFLVYDNPFLSGSLPNSVGNLSSSLQYFDAYNCRIQGSIPYSISNLSGLIRLSLYGNELIGSVPSTTRDMQNLQSLNLAKNKLSGVILDSLCGIRSFYLVDLGQNELSGSVPECLGNITSLRYLNLGSNRLSDNIPSKLWNLTDLLELNLSSNTLRGSLPHEVGNLKAARLIDLSWNQLSGGLLTSLGDIQNLETLLLNGNKFQGSIPETIGRISSLESLNLSHNNLSGSIPRSFEKLQYLKYFSVSFNNLSGEIPSGGPFGNFSSESFESNKALCGAPKFHVSPCPVTSDNPSRRRKKQLTYILIGVGTIFVVLALVAVYLGYRKESKASNTSELLSFRTHERISYYELLQATNGYDETNLLGKGGFGSVYTGTFSKGRTFAVKVFNLQVEGAFKSFDVECQVLRNLRHRNLTDVISSCSNLNFKALVLEFMPNGSLEKWLYSHNYFLDILQRLNIMIDVAYALHYLHFENSTPVVHCDLKPSNVLLDQDMVAHVSDFGIAKLLGQENSFTNTETLTTLGYMAPEYGLEGFVSPKCDVYSYGIMLMEVFTRVKPDDEMFGENLSLKTWITNSFPNSLADIIDANLLRANEEYFNEKLECISSAMEVALKCTRESSRERSKMKDVTVALEKIRVQLLQYH